MRYGRLFGLMTLMLMAFASLASRPVFAEDPRPPASLVDGAQWFGRGATVAAADGAVRVGVRVALPVQVSNVQKLGAATIEVHFDPARLKPVACQRSASFDVGFCNVKFDSDKDGRADTVRFNALSMTGVSTAATPVALAGIYWQAVTPLTAETATTLRVKVETFTDVDGNPMESTPQDGQVMLVPVRILLPLLRR